MELDETTMKRRFEDVVGGVRPDVLSLVDAGAVAGEGVRRRRRLQGVGLGAAGAVVIATVGYVASGQGLFDSDSTGPADGGLPSISQVDLVPSDPRALAAATMEHLTVTEYIAVGGSGGSSRTEIGATLGFKAGERKVELQVVATSDVAQWDRDTICRDASAFQSCEITTLADGSELAVLEMAATSAGGGVDQTADARTTMMVVGVLRGDQLVAAFETSAQASSVADLPLDADELQAIVTDPVVGLRTSQEMVDRGAAIEDWQDDVFTGESSSGSESSSVSPPEQVEIPAAPAEPGDGPEDFGVEPGDAGLSADPGGIGEAPKVTPSTDGP